MSLYSTIGACGTHAVLGYMATGSTCVSPCVRPRVTCRWSSFARHWSCPEALISSSCSCCLAVTLDDHIPRSFSPSCLLFLSILLLVNVNLSIWKACSCFCELRRRQLHNVFHAHQIWNSIAKILTRMSLLSGLTSSNQLSESSVYRQIPSNGWLFRLL
jgi:hypothetical protein